MTDTRRRGRASFGRSRATEERADRVPVPRRDTTAPSGLAGRGLDPLHAGRLAMVRRRRRCAANPEKLQGLAIGDARWVEALRIERAGRVRRLGAIGQRCVPATAIDTAAPWSSLKHPAPGEMTTATSCAGLRARSCRAGLEVLAQGAGLELLERDVSEVRGVDQRALAEPRQGLGIEEPCGP